MNKKNKGFTLLEMLVVVFIIGILAAIAIPSYRKSVEKSKATETFEILANIRNRQEELKHLAIGKNRDYTTSFSDLGEVIAGVPAPTNNTNTISTKYFDYTLYGNGQPSSDTNLYYAAAVRKSEGGKAPPYFYTIKLTGNYMDSATCCIGDDCSLVAGLVKSCPCPDSYETSNGWCAPSSKSTCDPFKGDTYKCCVNGGAAGGRWWNSSTNTCDCIPGYVPGGNGCVSACPDGMGLDSNGICEYICGGKLQPCPCGQQMVNGACVDIGGGGGGCQAGQFSCNGTCQACPCDQTLVNGKCMYICNGTPQPCPCDQVLDSNGNCVPGGGGGGGNCQTGEFYCSGVCQTCPCGQVLDSTGNCVPGGSGGCQPGETLCNGTCQPCPCDQTLVNGTCVPGGNGCPPDKPVLSNGYCCPTDSPNYTNGVCCPDGYFGQNNTCVQGGGNGNGATCEKYKSDTETYNCCLYGADSYGRTWDANAGACVCPDGTVFNGSACANGCSGTDHIVNGNCCSQDLNYYWGTPPACQFCPEDKPVQQGTVCCAQGQILCGDQCITATVCPAATCETAFAGQSDIIAQCKCLGSSSPSIKPAYGGPPFITMDFANAGCCKYITPNDPKDPALQGTVCEACASYVDSYKPLPLQ